MAANYHILVLNMGSTSTKVAYYRNEEQLDERSLDISREEIAGMGSIFDQYDLRRKSIEDYADDLGINFSDLSYIVSRGCGGGNQKSGGYLINEDLVKHCRFFKIPHASSLGPVITYDLMRQYDLPGYIYDSDGVNEFNGYAYLSGLKEFPNEPGSHTLNAKAAARKAAEQLGKAYQECNFVVCHMGGGVSTSAHDHGYLVDSNSNAYAPERVGGMPFLAMIPFTRGCFSGEYTLDQMLKMQMGGGGLMSYLGTSDLREVERRIHEGDKDAEFYYNGMIYDLSKDIAAMTTVLLGNVDGIVFTGGMAHSNMLIAGLKERIGFLAPVFVFPGSYEMEALVLGSLRIVRGEELVHEFKLNQ